jgi:hypothetical protein
MTASEIQGLRGIIHGGAADIGGGTRPTIAKANGADGRLPAAASRLGPTAKPRTRS